MKIIKRLKFWCANCKYATPHLLLLDVQSINGLLWRCERCHQDAPHTAFEAEHTESI